MVCAVAEALGIVLRHHVAHPPKALGLTLGEQVEVPDFGRGEEHRRGVRARRDAGAAADARGGVQDRKSTRLNSSHVKISYAVFCLKKKKKLYIDSFHDKYKQTPL